LGDLVPIQVRLLPRRRAGVPDGLVGTVDDGGSGGALSAPTVRHQTRSYHQQSSCGWFARSIE
jgi:hypothetical protein